MVRRVLLPPVTKRVKVTRVPLSRKVSNLMVAPTLISLGTRKFPSPLRRGPPHSLVSLITLGVSVVCLVVVRYLSIGYIDSP